MKKLYFLLAAGMFWIGSHSAGLADDSNPQASPPSNEELQAEKAPPPVVADRYLRGRIDDVERRLSQLEDEIRFLEDRTRSLDRRIDDLNRR